MKKLLALMVSLRDPQKGCPWDREQSFESLVAHTLEEAYEVAEAVEQNDLSALRDELGDLLFQVVFYAQLAVEQGLFDFEDVASGITDKLTRRHPHVFADASVVDAPAQTHAWEAYKAGERRVRLGDSGALAGVAISLPAMTRAAKLQKRAARVGFDWPEIQPVFAKVSEELEEVRQEITDNGSPDRIEEEIGDLLFACVNLARHVEINPETAMRKANRKFERRFMVMETIANSQSQSMSNLDLESLERLWLQAKSREHGEHE